MRTCSVCFAVVGKYKRCCAACGSTQVVRTTAGPKTPCTSAADARLLAGMHGPACVCGLRGPHECTRTTEWKQDTLSLLAMRQR
jgi:hypothetical protein